MKCSKKEWRVSSIEWYGVVTKMGIGKNVLESSAIAFAPIPKRRVTEARVKKRVGNCMIGDY